VGVFRENKQWSLSTWKYEPLNLLLTCVEGFPRTDRRLLASTLQFMLPVQSPLDLNRWKLIQLLKPLQLTETLSATPCSEAGRSLGLLQLCLHALCTLDICTQEAELIRNVLLRKLPSKSPVVTICTTRFNIQKIYILRAQCIYVFCTDLRTNSDYFPIQH
jgi:hypothetical protein